MAKNHINIGETILLIYCTPDILHPEIVMEGIKKKNITELVRHFSQFCHWYVYESL